MKQKEKEKLFFGNKSAKRLAFVVVFLICGFFIFNSNSFDFNLNKVQAQTETGKKCTDEDMESIRKECKCTSQDCRPDRSIANRYDTSYYTAEEISVLRCYNTLVDQNCDETVVTDVQLGQGVSNYNVEAYREEVKKSSSSSGGNFIARGVLWVFNVLLYAVFQMMGILLIVAGNLFDWGVDAKMFNNVINLTAVETGWKMVRDFLNLFFILILLFSAFCTIFQVTKYHIKTILLNLVIMALLVNFSYPISRVIIDAGNIPMYYFFQNIAGGSDSISKKVFNTANSSRGESTGIMKLVLPGYDTMEIVGDGDQTLKLIAAIIFIFIFALTLLVIAVLLIIRILVLVILIIFSPIGFVAAIFPGFSKYSSDWWEQLFKQSFFGTVMAFMLYISLNLMGQFQDSFAKEMAGKAATGLTTATQIIQGGVTLAVPIALLWIGILSAQKMGAFGASAVVGRATKVAKWAGRLPWRGTKAGFGATGIPGGAKKGWENFAKTGRMFGKKVPLYGGSDARELKEAKLSGLMKDGKGGWSKAQIEYDRDKANELRKKWKDQGGVSKEEALKKLDSKNMAERKAASMELAENIGFDNLNQYQKSLAAVKDDPVYKNMFNDKTKEKHIRFVIEDKAQKAIDKTNESLKSQGKPVLGPIDEEKIKKFHYNNELGKLSADKIAKQNKLLDNRDFKKHYLDDLEKKDHSFLVKIAAKADQKYRKLWKDASRGYGYKI